MNKHIYKKNSIVYNNMVKKYNNINSKRKLLGLETYNNSYKDRLYYVDEAYALDDYAFDIDILEA